MKQKKVLLLGGNYYQMTATKVAKRLGYHVISVDYLPDNPAHKHADEYYNVSTIDKDYFSNQEVANYYGKESIVLANR